MWKNKQQDSTQQKHIDSLIGAGTLVHGDVTFTGGLRIDGHIEGNVVAANGEPATLVISENALVHGEVRVSHVIVNGTINGPVAADDHLELQPKARILGDVRYRTMQVHVGAIVEGRFSHADNASASVVEFKLAAVDKTASGAS